MIVDLSQVQRFFHQAYPQEPWPGILRVQIFERKIKKLENGKTRTTAKLITSIPLAGLEDVDRLNQSALNLYQSQGYHFWYTCGFIPDGEKLEKDNVLAVSTLWADIDHITAEELHTRLQDIPLYPTGVVKSGGGFHLYWKLDSYYDIAPDVETALCRVRDWVGGDGVVNVNRLLRLPGTWNCKQEYETPQQCEIEGWNSGRVWKLADFLKSRMSLFEIKLPEEFKQKYIKEGAYIGENEDRSTRDFAVIKELVRAGHSDDEIQDIFANPTFGVSSKALERGPTYVELTINKARAEVNTFERGGVWDDGKVVYVRKERKNGITESFPISNFCLLPSRYLHFVDDDIEKLEFQIYANGKTKVVAMSSHEMISWKNFFIAAEFPRLAWFGDEKDWQYYMNYIFGKEIFEENASSVVGWVGKSFVLPTRTLFDNSVAYYHGGMVCPNVELGGARGADYSDVMGKLGTTGRSLHEPHIYFPVLGWVLASAFAPQVRKKLKDQFPLMMVHGDRGSGKTTLVRTFLRSLLGITSDYSIETTLAILRRAIAGSNSLPVYIDEYEHKRNNPTITTLNATLRIAYQAGQTQRMHGVDDYDSFYLRAPVILTSTTGIEDDALEDRTYNVRACPFDRVASIPALNWFESLGSGAILENWLQEDPDEWILDIRRLAEILPETDRQRLAFAVPAAVILWCSKKWGWNITEEDLLLWWNYNKKTVIATTPLSAIDLAIGYLVRNKHLVENFDYEIGGDGHIYIVKSQMLDRIVEKTKELDLPYELSRKYLVKFFSEAEQAGTVIDKEKAWNLQNRPKTARCVVLDLQKWPNVKEAL